jgi:recombination protein RecT
MSAAPAQQIPATTAPAVKPVDEFRKALGQMEGQFKIALPEQIEPTKFSRVVMTAVQQNQDLLAADRQSLFNACMNAAQDGLLPDGRQAALVTFRLKSGVVVVQYMPMLAGILKKVRNSGELAMITAQIVCEKDKFRYWIDDKGEHVKHEPLLVGDAGGRIGVYALAKTKGGHAYIEFMTVDQVMAVKAVSKAKDGPWQGAFEDEMWRKTVIRRLSKRLPMSTDLEQVIHRDDEMYDLDAETKPSKGKQLEQMINEPAEQKPDVELAPGDFGHQEPGAEG